MPDNADAVAIDPWRGHAYQALFNGACDGVKRDMALTVVDERWTGVGLHEPRHINLASVADDVRRFPVRDKASQGAGVNQADTRELAETSAMAEAGFTAHADHAFVERTTMVSAGLTSERCSRAYAIEWGRMIKGILTPGMTDQQRQDAVAKAAGNVGIHRRATMWDMLKTQPVPEPQGPARR